MKNKSLRIFGLALSLLLFSGILFAKDEKKPVNPFAKVDKQKVESAIKKGLECLSKAMKEGKPFMLQVVPPNVSSLTADELVLYTFVKSGATDDPNFPKFLERVLAKKLERTYQVSVLVMALSELDAKKYLPQIIECGQFLIDNQCENGQWDYGKPVEPSGIKIPKESGDGKDDYSKNTKRIQLKQRRKAGKAGDNSNTQYACLGLRSCMTAGVIIPDSIFAMAQQWLEKNQQKDGSWGYGSKHGQQENPGYGSMSVGALGSLIICKFYLTKRIPTNDPKVQSGLQWLIKNFTVLENPQFLTNLPPEVKNPAEQRKMWDYYYLYAMERLGAFLETETFGDKEWYPAGAEIILKQQAASGAWSPAKISAEDTCFAILFLRRATKPLSAVITGK